MYYTFNALGVPVREDDVVKWWQFKQAHGVVAQDKIGESVISTVFLGIDHRWGQGPPILWETMVFGGKLEGEQERCSGSREQAEAMHAEMIWRVRQNCPIY